MKLPLPGHQIDFAVLKAVIPADRLFVGYDDQPRGDAIPKGPHYQVRVWRDRDDGKMHREIIEWNIPGRNGRYWHPSTDDALAIQLMNQLATGAGKPWFFVLHSLATDRTPRFVCEFRSRSVDWKAVYVGRGHQVADTICQAIYVMYKRGIVRGGVTAVGKRADWMRL